MCKNFNDLCNEAKSCKDIDTLFALWRKAHATEENPINTFPKSKTKDYNKYEGFEKSFCRDGFISYDSNPARKTILFILREANVSNSGILHPELTDRFFVKDTWYAGDFQNTYAKFIKKRIDELHYNTDNCNIAYMNLNKRGGFGSINHIQLRKYVQKYKPFIEKEISLINPDIIICGGTYGTVIGLDIMTSKGNIKDYHHPAAWT